MKTHYTVAFAMLAGFGLGTVAVQGLHAQAKAPVYSVAEIDIADQAAYSTYASRRLRLRSRPLAGRSLPPEAKSQRWKVSRRNRVLSFNSGIVSKNSRHIAIQRPSRISCPSARRWQNFAASSSRAYSSLTDLL